MRFKKLLSATALIAGAASTPLAAVAADKAMAESPEVQALHLDWLNTSADPGQDFFAFADGGWQKANPIPGDHSRWGTFNVLHQRNLEILHGLLKEAAADKHAKPGSAEQKIGDFFASGMDTARINKLGISPLADEFARIDAIKSRNDLQNVIAHLQMIGVDAVFGMGEMQDFADSTKVVGVVGQGGLGLPDKKYYLQDDPKFKQIRAAYVKHVGKMFELLGDSADKAKSQASLVMAMETELAKASMDRAAMRDPHAIYNMKNRDQLAKLMPDFNWPMWFANMEHPELKQINVLQPGFFKEVDKQVANRPLPEWKTYLRWRLVDSFARYLSDPFVNENFQMAKVITGAEEMQPRWQRVINTENRLLGFAVGKKYVEKAFSEASRQQVLDILHNIRGALEADIKTLSWMSPKTRTQAVAKLHLIEERIGYPDKWRDYSDYTVDRGAYVLNVVRGKEFENRRELNKIGKPVDRDEWGMTPQEVNAYYDPSMNNINFPAGILQPPFFDPKAPAAVNYGAVGFVMGHEITHGFDDEGAQFDGHGNLHNWWTKKDLKRFKAATDCIADHFSNYTVDDGLHVNGKLVTGEATADLGGLTLAWRAFHASEAYKHAKTINGYTPDQQFFLGAAHVWASNIRPQEARRRVTTDPHPPARYRVNGTLANMPQFQKTYGVKDGSPMVNTHRCKIW
ncbi:MAG: M13 family metallopeptidase [Gammaproteobacteria bacterium]|jgi:putative endopeptidase